MSQLKTNLQEILAEKQQKIISENIRRNVSVFGVIGTLDEGIDTSDADAVAGDLAEGKTAYVNGEKITGNVAVIESNSGVTTGEFQNSPYIIPIFDEDKLIRAGGGPIINETALANKILLSADKIKQGETILGIEGTVVPEDPEHADYDDCLQLTEEILGNV
ncbi:hypothetical protein [uncultured Eubacterium sp.]|uniref:hypothetical protein n=1 Tax=uncultured Eubacterium sp. TaxID=165185 RepID=UPI0025994CB7|nr:hypothetical protein [uncultured Eubacterium sp.]